MLFPVIVYALKKETTTDWILTNSPKLEPFILITFYLLVHLPFCRCCNLSSEGYDVRVTPETEQCEEVILGIAKHFRAVVFV